MHLIVKICLRDIPDIEFRSAFSGEEGIKIAMDFQPDLILLDVMMPGMDGIATLKTLRLLPSLAKTPVIFLTAKAQKNEVEEYFKCGIVDVIVKPFDPNTLAKNVQEIWEKYISNIQGV
ncbi:MAG: response regulator [Parachlamydiaceae bacterium]|nr:MAG: response regulator [Parachlamydiaceae bacterium]